MGAMGNAPAYHISRRVIRNQKHCHSCFKARIRYCTLLYCATGHVQSHSQSPTFRPAETAPLNQIGLTDFRFMPNQDLPEVAYVRHNVLTSHSHPEVPCICLHCPIISTPYERVLSSAGRTNGKRSSVSVGARFI
jgi:hypothetical protein